MTNAANRALASGDPNSGQTQFLHDPCGRVRFVQPALGPGEQEFFYTRYDAIGRVVEQGTVAQAWNPTALAPLAAQADWPTADVARTVSLALTYDGDGSAAAQIGQKVGCVTATPAPAGGVACVTTEAFTYAPDGRLVKAGLVVSGPASSSGEVGYSYNNLGELTTLTLPSGAPLAQVIYTTNDQGWITAIGSSESSPADIAVYTYSADGAVETESLGNGAWVRQIEYMSPGWLAQAVATSQDKKQSLRLAYTYNPDSTVATRGADCAFASVTETLKDTYAYDGQGRLTSAQGSSNDQITSYDPNGNILSVTQGGSEQHFTQASGNDQLAQVLIGGASSPVVYDARGRLTSALGRLLSYDNATNLPYSATMNSQQVQFGYGSRRQRVLKQVSGKEKATTMDAYWVPGVNGLFGVFHGHWQRNASRIVL